ncbi:hypothetical protein N8089_03850 [Flavobacteriales bacterium]|nr:hypothetical protein [Flavobacteriales bacterium]
MKKIILTAIVGFMFLQSCKKPTPIYTNLNKIETLQEELLQFAPQPKYSVVNASEVISITTDKGNLITFPKNAFVDKNGNSITGNVEVSIIEITTKAEMILSNMPTNSDQGPLESQGEFLVEVKQNNNILKLADGVSFSIQNPNSTINSNIQGWDWVEKGEGEGEGEVTTFGQNGTWTATEFQGNNSCDIFSNLLFNLSLTNNETGPQEIWKIIQEMKSLLEPNIKKELNKDGPFDYLIWPTIDSIGEIHIAFNSENDEWAYSYYYTTIDWVTKYGLKDQETTAYTNYDFGEDVYNIGCEISLDSTFSYNLNPNVISLNFNTLNWCNIDQLISEYGASYDCKINAIGIPKTAKVQFVFPDLNGVLSSWSLKDEEFNIDRLPTGMPIQVVLYYKQDGKIMFGLETITASKDMNFNVANIIELDDIDALVKRIENL